jgi:hypothetical protein
LTANLNLNVLPVRLRELPHTTACPAKYVSSLVLAFVALCGCGEDNPLGRKAISGAVTLNGQPLDNGSITFEPVDLNRGVGGGSNIVDGKYSLPEEQGLPPGKYVVRIMSADASQTEPVEEMPGEAPKTLAKERIPPHWNIQSAQQIEVSAEGDNVHNFDVK